MCVCNNREVKKSTICRIPGLQNCVRLTHTHPKTKSVLAEVERELTVKRAEGILGLTIILYLNCG